MSLQGEDDPWRRVHLAEGELYITIKKPCIPRNEYDYAKRFKRHNDSTTLSQTHK